MIRTLNTPIDHTQRSTTAQHGLTTLVLTALGLMLLVTTGCPGKNTFVKPEPVVSQPGPTQLVEPELAEPVAEPSVVLEPDLEEPELEPVAPRMAKKQLRRIFFEFDQHQLTDEAVLTLESNARILRNHPELVLQVQGHCDELGTTEYNLALGEKRAASVRRFLMTLGVDRRQIKTVSYGEELPLGLPDDLDRNRRAEFLVLSQSPVVVGSVN